jgi:chromosome condensin MukBEF complex kleisin-like MukF subunit
MLEQNEDFVLPELYSWVEKADAGAKYGVDTTEYILFRAALEMASEDGSLKQEEVIDALKKMSWLTDKERDYLFSTRYESNKNNPFD